MSSHQVIQRDKDESYEAFQVRASAFIDGLADTIGDMSDADRLVLTDTGVVNEGRQVTLTIVKNSVDKDTEEA